MGFKIHWYFDVLAIALVAHAAVPGASAQRAAPEGLVEVPTKVASAGPFLLGGAKEQPSVEVPSSIAKQQAPLAKRAKDPAAHPTPAGKATDYIVADVDGCIDTGAFNANTAAWLACQKTRALCKGSRPGAPAKAKKPNSAAPKAGAASLAECSKVVRSSCIAAAKSSAGVVCGLELDSGYAQCSREGFAAQHAHETALACSAHAAASTGVDPASGAWVVPAAAAAGNATGNATKGGAKLDNPFESPYYNPHDNPYWSYYWPYGGPFAPGPWARYPGSGAYGNGGGYGSTAGGIPRDGSYENGRLYQFYGQWYQYQDGRWIPFGGQGGQAGGQAGGQYPQYPTTPMPPSTGSGTPATPPPQPIYVNNNWYQMPDGQYYMYNAGKWYIKRELDWYMYDPSDKSWYYYYEAHDTYYYTEDGKFYIPNKEGGGGKWYYIPKRTPVPSPSPAAKPTGRRLHAE